MAQLGVQYPSLEGLMGGVGGYATGQRMDIARQNEGINQAQALQDIFQQQQMDPIKLRQASLNADQTEAQLPGIQADSGMKQRNLQVRQGIPIDMETKAEISKLAASISEQDLKMAETQIQQLALHSDPKAREMGTYLMGLFREVQTERMKNADRAQRDMDVEALRGRNAKDLMQMQIDAGRFKGKGGVASVEEQLRSGKLNYEKAAVMLNNWAYLAESENDMTKAAEYRNLAQQYAQKHVESKQAGAMEPKAGAVDLGKLPGSKIPTVPPRQPEPLTSPRQAAPAAPGGVDYSKWTMEQWKQRYPNTPEEQLRAALKAKGFNPK